MIYLGRAKLVKQRHAMGVRTKSWDLTPWGGPLVFMGPTTQPLPAHGGTVDRGDLRLDTAEGAVWKLEAKDPAPTHGPSGRLGGVNLGTMLMVGIGAYALAFGGRLMGGRR